MPKSRTTGTTVRPATITDEVFARSVARIQAMTPAQLKQSLQEAGIITAKGKYTKPYRVLASTGR